MPDKKGLYVVVDMLLLMPLETLRSLFCVQLFSSINITTRNYATETADCLCIILDKVQELKFNLHAAVQVAKYKSLQIHKTLSLHHITQNR